RYGATLASVGDVNGDGYGDVLVGAPGYDYGQVDEGAVFLFLGSHQGLSWMFSWYAEGNQAGAALGVSVAGAGDVNGDGYPDGIVGAPGYTNTISDEGAAFIWFSGSPYGNPANASWSAFGAQENSDFGFSVAGGGDFNGDGYADVLVGAPYYDAGQTNEGAVFGYFGSETGPSPTHDWFHGADFANAEYGLSVAAAGDFNGDGFSDALVGAPKYYVGETQEGWAFIYLGSGDGLQAGAPWWNCKSNQSFARLGESVAYAGDVNGDGHSDILVGAPRWDSAYNDSGIALLWLGRETASPLGEPGNADWSTIRGQTGAWWGYAVASAGDVNGDGYSDVLVGSPFNDHDASTTDTGLAALWYGCETGVASGAEWLAEGQQEDCGFSWCLSSAGDVNGDGFSDILVGARSYDAGSSNEGRAFLYYGNDSRGLARTPEQWRSDLSAPIATLGVSDSETAFALQARGRTPIGRGRVRVEYEVKRFDVPFDGTGTVLGSWTDTGLPSGAPGSVVSLTETVTGLSPGTLYHWRLRFRTESPFFPRSPWLTLAYNGAGEADLRTAGEPPTGVADQRAPAATLHLSAAPNPMNPRTRLVYVLPVATRVHLSVYDVQGRLLRVLVDEVQEAGRHTVAWDGRREHGDTVSSGVYFARLEAGEQTLSHKLVVAR
ncbi:MAG: FG-GAP-like repeat-containing protein, partial [Candidatus Eiseniibacteriota bacterium]